jgi:hypothetical protein
MAPDVGFAHNPTCNANNWPADDIATTAGTPALSQA